MSSPTDKSNLSDAQRMLFLQEMANLGPSVALNFYAYEDKFLKDVEPFAKDWKPYNPRKKNAREGLSVTSLDGGLGGVPDLDSLKEFNQISGTNYDETNFTKPTSVFHGLSCVRPLLDLLAPDLGRSHLIRFGVGGHFPPHRDAFGFKANCFRVLVPIQNCHSQQFVFLMGDERLHLIPGRAYVIDTRRDHSVFSFTDQCTILVLNVIVSERSFNNLMYSVWIR